MTEKVLRTLIVDRSVVLRRIISDILLEIEELKIVAQAPDSRIAMQKVQDLAPDLIILDLDMPPEDNGLEVLKDIKRTHPGCNVIVVCNSSSSMRHLSFKALSAGAFEFVLKPVGESIENTKAKIEPDLKLAIQALLERLGLRKTLSVAPKTNVASFHVPEAANKHHKHSPGRKIRTVDLIVIGISTGGPPALVEVFSRLKGPLSVPVIIVQHIPPLFSEALANSIREKSGLWVEEAKDGMILDPGKIYLAPGGSHLKLVKGNNVGSYLFSLTQDLPENNCRPSIDYLLRSVAKRFMGRVALFIMTGMGTDGLEGAKMIKNTGGYIIAQDFDSCVVYGMPRVIVEAGLADEIMPLGMISEAIEKLSGNLPAKEENLEKST